MKVTFAERLNEALEVKNMTQAELSRQSGISKPRITSYLNGKYEAKQKAIYAIAKALNVSEAWLMGYDVPMKRIISLADEVTDREKLINIINSMSDDEVKAVLMILGKK